MIWAEIELANAHDHKGLLQKMSVVHWLYDNKRITNPQASNTSALSVIERLISFTLSGMKFWKDKIRNNDLDQSVLAS